MHRLDDRQDGLDDHLRLLEPDVERALAPSLRAASEARRSAWRATSVAVGPRNEPQTDGDPPEATLRIAHKQKPLPFRITQILSQEEYRHRM